MFNSLNITLEKIYESDRNEAAFLFACGHLKMYIKYSECLLAEPGDTFYEKNIDNCILGKDYLEKQKAKHGKNCVRNLLRIGAVDGFLKSYKIKNDNGYYEDQELVLDAFEKYLDTVSFSLEGRRFFDEAKKVIIK